MGVMVAQTQPQALAVELKIHNYLWSTTAPQNFADGQD
jgi:hypothetical protein